MIPWRNLKRFLNKGLRQPGYALRVLGRRLAAQYDYHFSGGKSCLPESVTLFLTPVCNLRCKMCGQWGDGGTARRGADPLKAMEKEELFRLIDQLAAFKPSVTLFGGEPLLHPQCLEAIRRIKRKGMHCLMITNGSLIAGREEELIDSGLDELNLSLDGPARLHDSIRGMDGLWEKIAAGVRRLGELKSERKKAKPLLNLQCTISRYNQPELREMRRVCSELKADSITFHNLIFLEPWALEKQAEIDKLLACHSPGWEGFVFQPEIDIKALSLFRRELLAGRWETPCDLYPNFGESQLKEYYSSGYSPRCSCLSPWLVAYIFPGGELRPCLNSGYSFGNVTELGLKHAWNGEKALRFRRLLKEKGYFPACIRCTELYRYS